MLCRMNLWQQVRKPRIRPVRLKTRKNRGKLQGSRQLQKIKRIRKNLRISLKRQKPGIVRNKLPEIRSRRMQRHRMIMHPAAIQSRKRVNSLPSLLHLQKKPLLTTVLRQTDNLTELTTKETKKVLPEKLLRKQQKSTTRIRVEKPRPIQ